MTREKIILVKLNQVVGYLYLPSSWIRVAIIHLAGGPALGDGGDSALWPVAKRFGCALFVPDYIGHCRSSGKFNFKTNIETICESEDFLKGKIAGVDLETGLQIKLASKTIVLVGSSWGGSVVPFLEKYRKSSISYLGLFKPVLDWNMQKKSEDVIRTDTLIKKGWKYVYRGYDKSDWLDISLGKKSEFNPIDNLDYLKGKTVYLCHGKNDKLVSSLQSTSFCKKLKSKFPEVKVKLKLVNQGHTSRVNISGLKFMLTDMFRKNLLGGVV